MKEDKKREIRSEILDSIYRGFNNESILKQIYDNKENLDKDDVFNLLWQWYNLVKFKGVII